MNTIKLVLLFVLVIACTAVVLQNQASWEVHFLWLTNDVPGIVLLFLTLAAGFIMGSCATLLLKRGKKPQR